MLTDSSAGMTIVLTGQQIRQEGSSTKYTITWLDIYEAHMILFEICQLRFFYS